MGDILRKKINNEKSDEMWEKVSKKMINGDPIPTKLCRTVLYEELHTRGTTNWGYVIEGYPKSPDQLVDLEHSVDGDADPDTVFKEVVQVIDRTLFIEDDGDGTSLGDSKKGTLSSSMNSANN
uniref:Bromo domain-containing protein n=1 Tax=Caenorhabditis tropicalis TaxID=1561998 RepID=A0A1I7U120_9PELO